MYDVCICQSVRMQALFLTTLLHACVYVHSCMHVSVYAHVGVYVCVGLMLSVNMHMNAVCETLTERGRARKNVAMMSTSIKMAGSGNIRISDNISYI
jgi:hypothetical protein